MKLLCASLILAVLALSVRAQTNPVVALWLGDAPGSRGAGEGHSPTLTVFPADPGLVTGAAMVICPGGGYGHLAEHEGAGDARWLNELGITAFVLKYRLGSAGYRHPVMMQDAARAVRLVRAHAAEWGIDTNRVGIIGSSAGGHLASTLVTHFDGGQADAEDPIERQSSRPNVGVLCYPVITLGEFTHQGSKKNLLGINAPPELMQLLSNELQVTSNTPPCFLWHTVEDKTVPVENSLQFASALRTHGVKFELHLYERGGHGLGLGSREWNPEKHHPWVAECQRWLHEQGFAR